MLGKSSKEKSHGFKYHRKNTKDNYKNILLNTNSSKILNFIGGGLLSLKTERVLHLM